MTTKFKRRKRRVRTRLTKLHRRIRKQLGLTKLGFRSERRVKCYRADELHPTKKIIIEINGDFVHGNPKLYGPDDKIGYGKTAREKWLKDAKRTLKLESWGYRVIVVWQSDDLTQKLEEIKTSLV